MHDSLRHSAGRTDEPRRQPPPHLDLLKLLGGRGVAGPWAHISQG